MFKKDPVQFFLLKSKVYYFTGITRVNKNWKIMSKAWKMVVPHYNYFYIESEFKMENAFKLN